MTHTNESDLDGSGLTRKELLARAAAGSAVLAIGGTKCGSTASEVQEDATPRSGGRLRVGVAGGDANEFIDGQHIVAKPSMARQAATFESLLTFDRDFNITTEGLAESVEAERADIWTIRLRRGIEFHNGKTLTADDVVYSLNRILDTELGLLGSAGLAASLSPSGIKKLDEYTVRLNLKQKDSSISDQLAQYYNNIVPVDYTRTPGKQIGTGPFLLESFQPGRQSVHVRNPNYWRSGQPYVDEVVVINFGDDTARVNALLGGQVDAVTDVPFTRIPAISNSSNLGVLESRTGGWVPFTMRIDQAPFNDLRVRQAFRLIVDRPEMISQVLLGHGQLGNDIYGIFDPCYNDSLPQRTQDLDRAKSLLKAAGQEGLTVELTTTNWDYGMNEGSVVFAQQAKGAGVNVNVNQIDSGAFFNAFTKLPFATSFWLTRSFLGQVPTGMLPGSVWNETHWPHRDSSYISLYRQALATLDEKKRCELIREMQREEYETGGYIIPYFKNIVDAHSTKVHGLRTSKAVLNLDHYGRGFRTLWLG